MRRPTAGIATTVLAALAAALSSTPAAGQPPADPGRPAFCDDRSAIPEQALRAGHAERRCEITGRTVVGRSITVVVPGEGEVAGGAHSASDAAGVDELVVTHEGGVVRARSRHADDGDAGQHGADAVAGTTTAAVGADVACGQLSYSHYDAKQSDTHHWRFAARTTPTSISQANATTAVTSGARWIATGHNSCGLATSAFSARQTYDGTTTYGANVTATGCGTRDSRNVASFGDLSGSVLGRACWWATALSGAPNEVVEADLMFDSSSRRWFTSVPSGCSGEQYDLASVATHEWGHVFGLGHVSETTQPLLTMSAQTRSCDSSARTLGKGDHRGMDARY